MAFALSPHRLPCTHRASHVAQALGGRRLQKPKKQPPQPPSQDKKYSKDASEFSTLYTLRSVPSGKWMGYTAINTAYVIAFKYKEHAQMVQSFAHEATQMELKNLAFEDITEHVEELCEVPPGSFKEANIPPINADLDAHLLISKKPNINKLGCTIETVAIDEYMAIPFEQNIGVVMAKRLLENTKSQVKFESEVIDPVRDLDLFRKTLLESAS